MIYKHKSSAMQALSKFVSHGYFYHTRGIIHVKKLRNFIVKMETKHRVNANARQRSYRRSKNQYNASLVVYPVLHDPEKQQYFYWFLVVTEGENCPIEDEKLLDVRKHGKRETKKNRLHFPPSYELVYLEKSGAKASFTWRITSDYYEQYRLHIAHAVAKKDNDFEIKRIINELYRLPGFRGIRHQVKLLIRYISERWKRIRSDTCPYIERSGNGYMRFVKPVLLTVDEVELQVDRHKSVVGAWAI